MASVKARYRYRIYPTPGQQQQLSKAFGCARVVWNDALALSTSLREAGEKYPGAVELQKQCITLAKQTPERAWLADAPAIALQQSIRDLDGAYRNFWNSCSGKRKGRKIRPPRFKKRRGKQSIRIVGAGFAATDKGVKLPKMGVIPVVWSRELPSKPSSVTIIKDAAGRYFASFVVEVEPQPLTGGSPGVGIDLGIATFATLSDGEKVYAPNPLKRNLKRLRKLQRSLSRKQKGSKRGSRARLKVAKLHAHITDIRTDFLHKLSTRIIRENQVVIVEDLNVTGMVKNRKLSRAISDLGWRQFRTMLEAKAEKHCRDFRVISRWEPTSQRCSDCGELGGKKELSVREWTCLHCGSIHDRDENAAINILVAGGLSETLNGRGGEHQTGLPAAACEASTHREPGQSRCSSRPESSALYPGEDVKDPG